MFLTYILGQWIDCWTTGCQPNTWAVVGCAQYEKTEIDKYACQDGYEYKCCTENEDFIPDLGAGNESRITEKNNLIVSCSNNLQHLAFYKKFSFTFSVEWYSNCTRTDCQSVNAGTRGCAQYLKTEMDRFPCAGGYEYECCVIDGRNEDLFPAANATNFGEFKKLNLVEILLLFAIMLAVYRSPHL